MILLFAVFTTVFVLFRINRYLVANRNRLILQDWVTCLQNIEGIDISAISISKKKGNEVHYSGSYNSFMKVLPAELQIVNGKYTQKWSYTFAIRNRSNETISQVAFYCSEYDNFGRVDSMDYICYTVEDLRPAETKKISIAHHRGVLVLEEVELFSTCMESLAVVPIRKALPAL